jgi:amino acid adenylation domain-containing protein
VDAGLVRGWNATQVAWPGPAVLPAMVAAQAAATPDAPALITADATISYAEFSTGVNRLARYLTATGTVPGDIVAVLLERGPDLLTAVHAVQAAGAAYLPLDPDLPPARTGYMCATAGARLVITTTALAPLLDGVPGDGPPARLLLDTSAAQIAAQPAAAPPVTIPASALAYVIYTSGSTGQPKGAAISHQAIANRLRWMQQALPLTPADRVAHKTPATFDVSVWELFWPLTAGAAIVIAAPGGHRDTGYLTRLYADHHVTTAHFVPSLLDPFLDEPGLAARLPALRQVICSGEALTPALADRFHRALPHAALHNLYGPTEAAVDVTWHRCAPGEDPLPIGTPIANTRIHILDPASQPAPIGVPGELCIAGTQLADGYLSAPALTAAAFTPDPDGPPGTRRYHTGDLARWLPNGQLDYLGRIDNQIKIRGIRIEPGEIEAALTAHPGVRAAAVHAWPHPAGPRLTAYTIPADPAAPPDPQQLHDYLATTLPSPMIPASYHTLDTLPLTPSGKLNRKALPTPAAPTPEHYQPPSDQIEARLATIWEKLFGIPAIGTTDDFFALGGHSLLALRLAVRIRQELGRELPVATVLAAPTIRQLADEVRRPDDLGTVSPIVPLRTTGDRPALFLSHALGGQVFRYRPLAARLGDDQPVYTIPARGLLPGEEPHETLEQMVDDYTRCIRAIRPHGPYVLGGFCIGGNIALEVARRLRADGEEVPVVFPVWSSADEPVVRSSLEDETMLMIHALAGGVNVLETVDLDELRGLSTDERLVAVVSAAAREQRLRPDTADLEQARRYLRVFRANAHAVGYYRHEPYDGDVVLLQPAEDPEITPGDDFGWRKVVAGRFAIAPIRGTRFTSVYEPLVDDMAAQIRRWMDHGFTDQDPIAG